MTLHVTQHAIDRYRERVADIPDQAIVAQLTTDAVLAAARFGAPYVRLSTGQRIVIVKHKVITVLPAHAKVGAVATFGFRKGQTSC